MQIAAGLTPRLRLLAAVSHFDPSLRAVAHVRIFKHYIHTPYLILGGVEFLVLILSAYTGHWIRSIELRDIQTSMPFAIVFAITLTLSMVAMGVYQARLREGYTGMMLRTAVSFFLIGGFAIAVISYLIPILSVGRGVLASSIVVAFLLIALIRWIAESMLDTDDFKTRILVLGTGNKSLRIATRMRRRSDQRGFHIDGYVETPGTPNLVEEHGARILRMNSSLRDYCIDHGIEEVVVAVDERRRTGDGPQPFPIDDLLDCRLSGINVIDVLGFFEREAGHIQIDLLQPSWMVFSDGFADTTIRQLSERLFDIIASISLLLVSWPLMLLTALAIKLEDGWRAPVFYTQTRVGLANENFDVIKFRSMGTNAEKPGAAVWAQRDDPRVTRVGKFIRRSRIDELPQLLNVLKGEMSFVGPRPERPEFVAQLEQKIPYYRERHRVKPGLTGWAQLCYPYGASDDDAKQKLQYDLYYLKNHSVLLDLLILVQTVEVVLVGDGAR